jgi:hypothetical protein
MKEVLLPALYSYCIAYVQQLKLYFFWRAEVEGSRMNNFYLHARTIVNYVDSETPTFAFQTLLCSLSLKCDSKVGKRVSWGTQDPVLRGTGNYELAGGLAPSVSNLNVLCKLVIWSMLLAKT